MAYHRWKPAPDLEPYVEGVWIQESEETPGGALATRVLPAGRVELVVNYGAPFVHEEGTEDVRVPRVAIQGQRSRPVLARATGRTRLVIVRLRPWAAGALSPDIGSLVDTFVDAAEVLGAARADELLEIVHRRGGAAERARAVQASLLSVLRPKRLDPLVEHSTRLFTEPGGGRITQVSAALSISRRHLHRRFCRAVGIAPKRFSAIVRFQNALGRLMAGGEASEVALDCGYVDQAHMIHDVRAFAGHTPRAITGRTAGPLQRTFNGANGTTIYL